MGIELVGTRTAGMTELESLAERLQPRDRNNLAIASAYWDHHACSTAIDLAARAGGRARLVLWTAGGTRRAWSAAREASDDPGLELRFIDSPPEAGIFHAKLAGLVAADGMWTAALVGSANLTTAGRTTNVELGVLMDAEETDALLGLQRWYDELWDAALPAADLDWATALEIAPERSEAAARKRIFAEARLAPPAPASPAPG
ncbi:MAG: PLD-like domain [Thermoleophilia bacterium]|nr:PLD-like domain [Thermoleophilia bacterium]